MNVKQLIIHRLITTLFDLFGPEEIKIVLDDLIDKVENRYQDRSGSRAFAVMTLTKTLRSILDIPDDIGGDLD